MKFQNKNKVKILKRVPSENPGHMNQNDMGLLNSNKMLDDYGIIPSKFLVRSDFQLQILYVAKLKISSR